jgi:hypothetical protein
MGLSETILAAIIGALATMATAIVQLMKNRAPAESRPKKNRVRSTFAIVALMIGCIVGGYAWSALRAVSAREELEMVLDAKNKEQLASLVASLTQQKAAEAAAANATAVAARAGQGGVEESIAQLAPCHSSAQPDDVGPVTCTDRMAQKISLCAAIPAAAQTKDVRIQARVPKSEAAWTEGKLGDAAVGNLHLGTAASESPLSADQRSVCVDVANYSLDEALVVRVIVEYVFPAPAPAGELTAAAPVGQNL